MEYFKQETVIRLKEYKCLCQIDCLKLDLPINREETNIYVTIYG